MNININLPNKYIKIDNRNVKLGRLNSKLNLLYNNNVIILYLHKYSKKLRKNFNNVIFKYTGTSIKNKPYNYYYNNYKYLLYNVDN